MNQQIRSLVKCFAFLLISTNTFATGCNVLDFKDTSNFRNNLHTYLSYVNTTDQTNFEQRKSDLNLGGDALIKGIPFKAFASFTDFNTRKSEILAHFDYKQTVDQDTSYIQTQMSQTDRDAYVACLRSTAGLDVVAVKQSGNDVSFRVFWIQPTRETPVTALKVTATGGTLISGNIPENGQLPIQPELPLVYTLKPNRPFHLIVTTVPPNYSPEVDYLIPKYKSCRDAANGLERNEDGSEHITSDVVSWQDMNAKYIDYDKAWGVIYSRLKSGGHTNIQKVSQVEVDGKDNRQGKIDRNYTFHVTYDALYKNAENSLCGVDNSAES